MRVHLIFQGLSIHNERAQRLVVFYYGIEHCRCLEEVVLAECMQLIELHRVETELSIYGRFQEEPLLSLICNHLYASVRHLIKLLTSELFYKLFRVRLG